MALSATLGVGMNKQELIEELQKRLGSRKAADHALAAVVDVIIREVAKGGKVTIAGFGTFEKAPRTARTGRNPRTGEIVRIKKTNVPRFRAGSSFKEVVRNPRSLPPAAGKSARAVAAPGEKAAPVKKGVPAKKATAKKAAPAKKATAKKATAKKATVSSETRAAPPGPRVLPPRPPRTSR